MSELTRIIPVMVNDDGTMSVHVVRQHSALMSFPSMDKAAAADIEAEVLSSLPAGLLSGESTPRIVEMKPVKDGSGSVETNYVLVAGNEQCFSPLASLEDGRWIGLHEFKVGPLPQNSPDVAKLRHVYTGSMSDVDLVGLMLGLQTVRSLRDPEYPIVLGSPDLPLEAAIATPAAFALALAPHIDRKLPLNLSPSAQRPNQPLDKPHHQAEQLGAQAVKEVKRRGRPPKSRLDVLPREAAEAAAAQRLQKSGSVPKPA